MLFYTINTLHLANYLRNGSIRQSKVRKELKYMKSKWNAMVCCLKQYSHFRSKEQAEAVAVLAYPYINTVGLTNSG